MTRPARRGSGRGAARGQTLTEFALVFPVLIIILFGVLDLGRAVFAYHTIGNAAREGARVAIVNQIQDSTGCSQARPIENPATPFWSVRACAAAAAGALGVQASDVAVTYSVPTGTTLSCAPSLRVGCIARVTVAHQFTPFTPVVSTIVGSIAMSSTSEAPIERVFP